MVNNSPLQNLPNLRVGLLQCDDVEESVHHIFGNYYQMFADAFRCVDPTINLVQIRCDHGELPDSPHEFDAFVISGSKCGVYESQQWILALQDFVGECYAARKKTVGICFGHQLIAHALGGETRKAEVGWGFGVHRASINGLPPWMKNNNDEVYGHDIYDSEIDLAAYNLVVVHQDQIVTLPPGFRRIAHNEFCPMSMIIDGDAESATMLGLQGHPEFTKKYCKHLLMQRKDKLTDEQYRRALESLKNFNTDSEKVFRWIIRFIRHNNHTK